MENYIYPIIFYLSIALLIFYLYKTHKRWLATVCIRVIVGIIAIFVINFVFTKLNITCMAGVNPITISTLGLLGLPGLLLIYGSVYFFTNI